MKFSFGIITDGKSDENLERVINSIRSQEINDYEIIIIGNSKLEGDVIKKISFNESQKSKWITKKKNLITKEAKYENVVYLHDYVVFGENWYKGFLDFGDDWSVCMNVIKNKSGSRFRDWCLWFHDAADILPETKTTKQSLLPYDVTDLSEIMYISGTYWVAKKHVMEEFPLNESLAWGQGEDVEWSKRVRGKYPFSMNTNSSVQFLKDK